MVFIEKGTFLNLFCPEEIGGGPVVDMVRSALVFSIVPM